MWKYFNFLTISPTILTHLRNLWAFCTRCKYQIYCITKTNIFNARAHLEYCRENISLEYAFRLAIPEVTETKPKICWFNMRHETYMLISMGVILSYSCRGHHLHRLQHECLPQRLCMVVSLKKPDAWKHPSDMRWPGKQNEPDDVAWYPRNQKGQWKQTVSSLFSSTWIPFSVSLFNISIDDHLPMTVTETRFHSHWY